MNLAAQLAIIITWLFVCGLALAGIGAVAALAYQKWTIWRLTSIRQRGPVIIGTVLEKHYSGGPLCIRKEPHMTVKFRRDDQELVLDQIVPDDAFFHYEPGDQIEIVVFGERSPRFVPLRSIS